MVAWLVITKPWGHRLEGLHLLAELLRGPEPPRIVDEGDVPGIDEAQGGEVEEASTTSSTTREPAGAKSSVAPPAQPGGGPICGLTQRKPALSRMGKRCTWMRETSAASCSDRVGTSRQRPSVAEAPAVERAHQGIAVEAALRQAMPRWGAAVAQREWRASGARGPARSARPLSSTARRPVRLPAVPRLRACPTQYHALPRGWRIASGSSAASSAGRCGLAKGAFKAVRADLGHPSYAPPEMRGSAGRERTNGRRRGASQAGRGHLPSRHPQPTKGGDPVSHCHQPCVSAHRTWTVASGASL